MLDTEETDTLPAKSSGEMFSFRLVITFDNTSLDVTISEYVLTRLLDKVTSVFVTAVVELSPYEDVRTNFVVER